MNALRLFGVVLMLVVAALTLGAAPPQIVTLPDTAPYLDGDYHVIPANTTLWYRFNYEGDHSQIFLRLLEGNKNALQFMIHKPAQMGKWWDNPSPVGRGSPEKDDMIWSGNSHEGGPWYIELMNYNDKPVVFRFDAAGKGILPTTAPVLAPATAPVAAVLQPTEATFTNTDPTRAIPVSDKQFVIPANTTLWYSFFYPGDHSQITVRLPRGAEEKLRYMIHTPKQMSKWWDVDPIGQGSVEKDDLVWSGNSHEGGTYYIEVSNDNPYAVGFYLTSKYVPRPIE